MKVAIIGGTGRMGGALAKALSGRNEVVIGSRDPARAKEAARLIPGATGSDYLGAAKACDVAVFSIPYAALGEAVPLAEALRGKLAISMVSPMVKEGGSMTYPLEERSAAEELAAALPGSRVATAFNNVPERSLSPDAKFEADVLIAASSREAYEQAAALVREVPGMRPLYAGPLSSARLVEQLTVLELNLGKLNGTKRLAPRFVSEG